MAKVFVNKRKVITTTSDVVTEEIVTEAIRLHLSKLVKNYIESEDMYLSQHEVLKMDKKDNYIDFSATIEIPTLSLNSFGETPTCFLKNRLK